jgi:hypothetical protein
VPIFEQPVIDAVLHHMNSDHPDDNELIVRAFGAPDATAVVMTTLDQLGGTWTFQSEGSTGELTVPWSAEIGERAEIRREIVVLYDKACEILGVTPRPH